MRLAQTRDQPMDAAMDAEIVRLETTVATGGIWAGVVGLIITFWIAARGLTSLAAALIPAMLGFIAWFALVRRWLRARRFVRVLPLVNPLLETVIPTAVAISATMFAGPEVGATGSAALQSYGLFITLAVLRLHPLTPLAVGVLAAIEYGAVYLLLVLPNLPESLRAMPSLQAGYVLVVRCGTLVLAGGMGTLVSVALRGAVRSASREVRARELFGKYRIEEKIASGGMGVVYRATYCPEGGFERPVALKRLHPHLLENDDVVRSFRQEAELSARLNHPNIVQVLDFGRVDDTFFLAMEYVKGVTLLDFLIRARASDQLVPSSLVAQIGREMCQGLAYAHSGALLEVVHRDLTPTNVVVSHIGEVKILDFGVAKALKDAERGMTSTVVGKFSHMAPEQARGGVIDARCDVFAVGAIIWELLCLCPLFARDTEAETLVALLEEDIPRPSEIQPDLPAVWDDFCMRALARDPAKRFQSAQEMLDALGEILDEQGLPRADELQSYLAALPPEPTEIPPPSVMRKETMQRLNAGAA